MKVCIVKSSQDNGCMTLPAVSRHATSEDLSRNPTQVFCSADEGPVTISRRDGEQLTLLPSRTIEREHEAFKLVANLAAAALGADGASLPGRLLAHFSWLGFLPIEQREQFSAEIVETTRACASINNFDRLFVVLTEWKATAEAVASGFTPDTELDWLTK